MKLTGRTVDLIKLMQDSKAKDATSHTIAIVETM